MMTYYETLGVAKDATPEQIKATYRKLAAHWHPDRNKAPEAEARMKEVQAAYDVLSDPAKRAEYDTTGGVDTGRAARMQDTLCRLLFQCLNDLEPAGAERQLFEGMYAHMQNERNNGVMRRDDLQRLIPKRKKLAERITRKSGGENLFASVILNDVAIREKELASVEQAIRDVDEMCNTIREYELKGDLSDIAAQAYAQLGSSYFTKQRWIDIK